MKKEDVCRNLPTIETDRLNLRKLRKEDLDDMYAYGSDSEVSKHVSWETHQSISDTKLFLDMVLEQYEKEEAVFWGIELKETNKLIGTINYVTWSLKHKVGEIGYVLSKRYWGNGIMTEATKEVIEFGFKRMELERIQARCFVENEGSEKVMKKVGMSFEGTLRRAMFAKGKHHDLKMYSILKEEYDL